MTVLLSSVQRHALLFLRALLLLVLCLFLVAAPHVLYKNDSPCLLLFETFHRTNDS
jgi:hypothetical protein